MILEGMIDRRILVNVRMPAESAAAILPRPFRPLVVRGWAVAGVCLIRLRQVRPQGMPAYFGVSSENAAHRIAVEWDQRGCRQCGVYIPRRETASRMNALAGGRLFPGVHHWRRFRVAEQEGRFRIRIDAEGDTDPLVELDAQMTAQHESRLFDSVALAEAFFRQGAVGYSPSHRAGHFDGMELRLLKWSLTTLRVDRFQSRYFEDMFGGAAGAAELDSAYLMQQVAHSWHPLPALQTPTHIELPADKREDLLHAGELSHAS